MEVIAFMLVVLFIGIIIMVNVFYRSAKKNRETTRYVAPDLGIQPSRTQEEVQHIRNLIQHLESSMDPSYIQMVKERVIHEHRISETEWDNRWFEWQRFLLLSAICGKMPMYSREVDEIWHEMLIFNREYEDFSKRLFGYTFHHPLHGNELTEGLNREERAWFDLLYVTLFQPTAFSQETWGTFLKYPIQYTVLQDFRQLSVEALQERYFQKGSFSHIESLTPIVTFMIHDIKQYLEEFEQYVEAHGTAPTHLVMSTIVPMMKTQQSKGWLVLNLFLSVYYHENFETMHSMLHKTIMDKLKSKTKQKKTSKMKSSSDRSLVMDSDGSQADPKNSESQPDSSEGVSSGDSGSSSGE